MNRVLPIIIGVLIVGGVGWLVVSSRNAPERSNQQAESEKAPDFNLKDYSGNTVRIADFQGKPLVINSWAAWCSFCRKELVDFVTVQKEFGDRVIIIAVDRAESLTVAKKYTDELGVTNGMLFLLDPTDPFFQSIGGFSMPETIFADAKGTIVFHKRGPMNVQEMREKIQQLLSR
ncbi:TlpA family protein disulfide reductase [Candidatus Azambacteria bacterium]|nr:TlpA family protein disulfide reductase [Candidatus Azambacteria bacterium]MBI3684831.1 TlpA family protein disulfide reductase [Candidatus Azambacteria bacterium]